MNRRHALIIFITFLLSFSISGNCRQRDLDVPYVPTPMPVVQEMLRLADLEEDDIVYDLGCGDGRILIEAAVQHGIKGYGVDIDPERIKESRQNAADAGVDHLLEFHQQDLFQTDIRDASVVMLYLLPSVNIKLRPKLLKELRPGTRIISHDFDMNEWLPDKTSEVMAEGKMHTVYYWVVSANVIGNWKLKLENFSSEINAYLYFDQHFQFPQGELISSKGEWELSEVHLKGDRISFKIKMSNDYLSFTGRIYGNKMQGEAQRGASDGKYVWKAFRDPPNKKADGINFFTTGKREGKEWSPGSGDMDAVFVYAYKKKLHTNP